MKKKPHEFAFAFFFAALIINSCALAQQSPPSTSEESAGDVAKKLSNPVANLTSVPLQNNSDWGIGHANGSKNTLNIQPVIPISLTPKWNLITRWIVPIVTQYDIVGERTNQTGLSDGTFSGFFSPVGGKIIWGVGPAFHVPIATNDLLATKKFGVGPTVIVAKQTKGWTLGALMNQIFTVAGDADRPDVNQLLLQPFIAYNYKSGAGITVNAEMIQNWDSHTFIATLNPTVSGVTRFGKQTISIAVGPRIPLAAPEEAKAAFGIRSALTFVFTK